MKRFSRVFRHILCGGFLLCTLFMIGCRTVHYEKQLPDGSIAKFTLKGIFTDLESTQIDIETSDGTKVKIGSINTEINEAAVKAVTEGIIEGVVEGVVPVVR